MKLDGVTIIAEGPRAYQTLSFNLGQYKTTALRPGEYSVYTLARESTPVINQIHPGQDCTVRAFCDQSEIAQAQRLTVTAGNNVPDVDFVLLDWATISGTVRKSDGAAVPNKSLDFDDGPFEHATGWTDANGVYVRALRPGSYVVTVQNGKGYAGATRGPVRHPNVDCLSGPCTNFTGATPFDLVAGATTTANMQVRSERSVFTGRATKGTAGGPAVKLNGISVFSEAGHFFNVANPFQSAADGTYHCRSSAA